MAELTPRRIQRKREKGWRMPPNTAYVGRGSKWGNQFRIGQVIRSKRCAPGGGGPREWAPLTAEEAVRLFRDFITPEMRAAAKRELRGKNVACWCDEDEPFCHGDVWLELANEGDDHA